MVSRYTHGDKCGGEYNCYAIMDKGGDFVCYDDYKLLEAENATLKEALLEIQDYAISPWIVKDRCEQALKGESDV